MIKKYDRKTHSEFIKKIRKLYDPKKWDRQLLLKLYKII